MSHYEADRLDRHAYTNSPVHRLDPRAKTIATLVFIIVVVSFPKYAVASLVPFVLFPLTMAIMGFVPSGLLASRLLVASPFIVFIGAFNPLLDRSAMFHVYGVGISGGWVSFASILLRGFWCVSAAIILVATTSVARIAEALGALKAPSPLTVQLTLLYRYLFLLVAEGGRMRRARALRAGSDKTPLRVAAGMMGTMLIRTVDRSETIWGAMQARGFDGHIRAARKMKWRLDDTLFLAAVCGSCLALRLLPVIEWLGGLIT